MNQKISNPTKIFVGSLPASATEQEIHEYFSNFGPVLKVNLRYDRSKSDGTLNFGYCHVIMQDVQGAQEAKKRTLHLFQGRKIKVTEFLTGDYLSSKLVRDNHSRIIIKNWPQSSSEQELRRFFGQFGHVLQAYFFRNSHECLPSYRVPTKQQATVVASVLFETVESAKLVLDFRNDLYQGRHKLKVEQYHHKKGKEHTLKGEVSTKDLTGNSQIAVHGLATLASQTFLDVSMLQNDRLASIESVEPNKSAVKQERSGYLIHVKPTKKAYHSTCNLAQRHKDQSNLLFQVKCLPGHVLQVPMAYNYQNYTGALNIQSNFYQ